MENTNEFEHILEKEELILDSLIKKQSSLKIAVTSKSWENLTCIIEEINFLYEEFSHLDVEREVIQNSLNISTIKQFSSKISVLRSKLLRFKIENQALSKYVNITKEFIQEVVENALPQSASKVYSSNGMIVQPQPQSVVVNLSF